MTSTSHTHQSFLCLKTRDQVHTYAIQHNDLRSWTLWTLYLVVLMIAWRITLIVSPSEGLGTGSRFLYWRSWGSFMRWHWRQIWFRVWFRWAWRLEGNTSTTGHIDSRGLTRKDGFKLALGSKMCVLEVTKYCSTREVLKDYKRGTACTWHSHSAAPR